MKLNKQNVKVRTLIYQNGYLQYYVHYSCHYPGNPRGKQEKNWLQLHLFCCLYIQYIFETETKEGGSRRGV
jgi:hypothetical protein